MHFEHVCRKPAGSQTMSTDINKKIPYGVCEFATQLFFMHLTPNFSALGLLWVESIQDHPGVHVLWLS
jgi:hypothetical protein